MADQFRLDADIFARLATAQTADEIVELLQLSPAELDNADRQRESQAVEAWGDIRALRKVALARYRGKGQSAADLATTSVAPPETVAADESFESTFIQILPTIRRAIRTVSRRRRLSADEAEEFESRAFEKLVEDRYRRLRSYEGRRDARLSTFLVMVVDRLCLDYLVFLHGRWRPSAAASRLGEQAIEIERMMRDGYSRDEIWTALRTVGDTRMSRQSFDDGCDALPLRPPRQFESVEVLEERPASEALPDAQLEEAKRLQWMRGVIAAAQSRLTPRDRLILKLRLIDGLSAQAVAAVLHTTAAEIYQRVPSLLDAMRKALKSHGVDADTISKRLMR